MSRMNKHDLAEMVYRNTGHLVNKVAAREVVSEVFIQLAKCLSDGNDVMVVGFGKFYLKDREARSGITYQGKVWHRPAGKNPCFKPSRVLTINLDSSSASSALLRVDLDFQPRFCISLKLADRSPLLRPLC